MPKDPKKNVDRYKIRGGDLNEFEFHQNQADFAEPETAPTNLIPGTPPETKARLAPQPAKKAAGAKAVGTKKKSSKQASSKKSAKLVKRATVKGATAKKLAARKAAKKKAAKKTTAKKSAKK